MASAPLLSVSGCPVDQLCSDRILLPPSPQVGGAVSSSGKCFHFLEHTNITVTQFITWFIIGEGGKLPPTAPLTNYLYYGPVGALERHVAVALRPPRSGSQRHLAPASKQPGHSCSSLRRRGRGRLGISGVPVSAGDPLLPLSDLATETWATGSSRPFLPGGLALQCSAPAIRCSCGLLPASAPTVLCSR